MKYVRRIRSSHSPTTESLFEDLCSAGQLSDAFFAQERDRLMLSGGFVDHRAEH